VNGHRLAGPRFGGAEPHALDACGARLLERLDGQLDAVDLDRLAFVAQQHRERAGHRGGGADGRRVAGEHVVDGDGAVAADLRRAADQERGHAELALVGLQRVGDRGERQQRREQLVLDDLEGERAGRRPIGLQRDLDGHQRRARPERAGDRRRAILAHRADDVADGGQLLRDVQAR